MYILQRGRTHRFASMVPKMSNGEAHFAEPTFSSRAKQIDPHEWPVMQSPPAVRSGSTHMCFGVDLSLFMDVWIMFVTYRRSRSPYRSSSAPSSPQISPRPSPRLRSHVRDNQAIMRFHFFLILLS